MLTTPIQATAILLAAAFCRGAASSSHAEVDDPADVLFFDMDAAMGAEALAYEEQLLAFVFQGLVNRADRPHPAILFNAGYINYDWPGSDLYWHGYLSEQGRVRFTNVSKSTLCGLVTGADLDKVVRGTVLYDPTAARGEAHEWAIPIAATLAAQESLLPTTSAMLSKFPCLAALPQVKDLRNATWAGNATAAWEWAFEELLPRASRTVAYNLYHFEPNIHTNPESNATLANIDLAVQQKAFIMNFRAEGADDYLNPLFSRALANMEPLFSLYGWADDEGGLVDEAISSGASPSGKPDSAAEGGGGAVFCSMATPNLSFWKLLTLPGGRSTSHPLPIFDRKMKYDPTKKYVLLETNEGDTPRIVVSLFSQSWTDPRRGSVPVSWSINPVLAEQFPALFDYFASTAGANDSFISGPGGCGYVHFERMTDAQIKTFATRCGRLMDDYGPAMVDVYGGASHSILANFSRYAAVAGTAPAMYLPHPPIAGCSPTQLDVYQPDGTPVLCTAEGEDNLFYVPKHVLPNVSCVSCELARRINAVAETNHFVSVYGGLKWKAHVVPADRQFWPLWTETIAKLDEDIVVVGAQEMTRLAKEARQLKLANKDLVVAR